MSMADFASALQGGGGPPPDMGGGMPPPGIPTDPMGAGPPPEEPMPEEQGAEYTTSLEALDGAEQALHAFIQIDPDEADRAEATKALQIIIKLKASNQDSSNAGDLMSLQRSLQGGPEATAGALAPPPGPPMGGGF